LAAALVPALVRVLVWVWEPALVLASVRVLFPAL